MTTWSDLTTALKRLLQTLLKVIKGRISFKWMGEQESDTPLSSNERVPLGIQMKNANFRHAYYKNLTMNTEIQAEYILLNAHFKRLVNSIAKNNSGLEMLWPDAKGFTLFVRCYIASGRRSFSISKGRDIWSLSAPDPFRLCAFRFVMSDTAFPLLQKYWSKLAWQIAQQSTILL